MEWKITKYAQNIISKIGTEKKSSERVYDRDTVMAMRSRIQEELQAGRMPTDDEVQGFDDFSFFIWINKVKKSSQESNYEGS